MELTNPAYSLYSLVWPASDRITLVRKILGSGQRITNSAESINEQLLNNFPFQLRGSVNESNQHIFELVWIEVALANLLLQPSEDVFRLPNILQSALQTTEDVNA